MGVRAGIGFYSEKAFYVTIPIGVNYLFKLKNNNSFIDAGLGITWTRNNSEIFSDSENLIEEHFINYVPSIGYRRHAYKNIMWRISITPVINEYRLVPWLGFSIGKRF
ncbi:MAG: hypothetical protein ACK5NK_11505 [Niabella sp.]